MAEVVPDGALQQKSPEQVERLPRQEIVEIDHAGALFLEPTHEIIAVIPDLDGTVGKFRRGGDVDRGVVVLAKPLELPLGELTGLHRKRLRHLFVGSRQHFEALAVPPTVQQIPKLRGIVQQLGPCCTGQ